MLLAPFRSSTSKVTPPPHVAAGRCHAALYVEPTELALRHRGDVDVEPVQVSRSRPDQAEIAPDTVGRVGSPDMVDRACSTMSPGSVAVSFGTATTTCLGLEVERHVAHRLLVVDQLADLERGLEREIGRQAAAGRGGSGRSSGRRGRRFGRAPDAAGCDSAIKVRSRSISGKTSLASIASPGFRATDTEPVPVSWPSMT